MGARRQTRGGGTCPSPRNVVKCFVHQQLHWRPVFWGRRLNKKIVNFFEEKSAILQRIIYPPPGKKANACAWLDRIPIRTRSNRLWYWVDHQYHMTYLRLSRIPHRANHYTHSYRYFTNWLSVWQREVQSVQRTPRARMPSFWLHPRRNSWLRLWRSPGVERCAGYILLLTLPPRWRHWGVREWHGKCAECQHQ